VPRLPCGRLGALLATVALGLGACATAPDRLPPEAGARLRPEDAAALVRRWDAAWQAFPGLRATVDLTVRRGGRTERAAALLLLSPTHLRLEIATPFGLPALVATGGPGGFTVFRPVERKAWTARPTADAVSRWLGVPMPPELLPRLLAGQVPPPTDPGAVRVARDRGSPITFERGALRVRAWPRSDGQPARVLLENGERLLVDLEWAVNGALQSVRLEAPGRAAEVLIRYVAGEYVSPPPEAFELILPADIQVESAN